MKGFAGRKVGDSLGYPISRIGQRRLADQRESMPHYIDDKYLQSHAETYTTEVLSQREEILQDYTTFKEDTVFVAYLTEYEPDLYEFRLYRVRLLEYAERHAAHAKPDKESITPEQYRNRQGQWG